MRLLAAPLVSAGLLALFALAAAPTLTGCDSGSTFFCESDDEYAFEDTTPDSVATFGATIGPGDCVITRYEGRLASDGTVFDRSRESGVALYVPGLVQGFQRGLLQGSGGDQGRARRVGESFRVTIPPNLGYGARPQGSIPSCSTLEFDVTVLDTAPLSACGR